MSDLNIEAKVEKVIGFILEDYKNGRDVDRISVFDKPDKAEVVEIVNCSDRQQRIHHKVCSQRHCSNDKEPGTGI